MLGFDANDFLTTYSHADAHFTQAPATLTHVHAFMNAKMPRQTPILVFSDDWGRHPSSSQHLIRHLLPHRDVIWVNTIGTRPPRLDTQTLHRVSEKFRHWSERSSSHDVDPSVRKPQILNPRMWPSFASSFSRKLNRHLLLKALTPVVNSLGEPPIVVTTLPIVADLVGVLRARSWVYYCVDDFSVWPGYDGKTMQRMERALAPNMDRIIAVSEKLVEHVGLLGKSAELLTHGVDTDRWKVQSKEVPRELYGLEPPFIVFWGVVDRRMDTSYVASLASRLEIGTVVMFGPQDDPDPAMLRLPKVIARPSVPFERLPDIAAAASVLVMPYADLPVTRAIQPLKLKEYLASGRPVVVRALPSTFPWQDACDVCDTAESFTEAVIRRISTGVPNEQLLARDRLTSEGWREKATIFSRLLES